MRRNRLHRMAPRTVLASIGFLLLLTRGPFTDAGENPLKSPTSYGSLFCVCVIGHVNDIVTDYDMVCRSGDSSDHTVCGERPVEHDSRVLLHLCGGRRSAAGCSEETAGNRGFLQVRPPHNSTHNTTRCLCFSSMS